MALFLSTHFNKVDKKGRVSVPASFRSVLANQNYQGIIVYSSFIHSCIEACSFERIEQLSQSIDDLDPFSEERDAFATTILGGSVQLPFDKEGRVMLPLNLLSEVEVEDRAVFVGKGKTFEIWSPEKFEDYSQKAKEIAKKQRANLRLNMENLR